MAGVGLLEETIQEETMQEESGQRYVYFFSNCFIAIGLIGLFGTSSKLIPTGNYTEEDRTFVPQTKA